jgi:hypothetical protein
MRNTKTRRRQDTQRSAPTQRPHLRVVGPDFRPGELRARPVGSRQQDSEPLPHQFFCVHCECEITRFDADIHWVTGRCAPCDEAMEPA